MSNSLHTSPHIITRILCALVFAGSIILYCALTPRSQPCWFPPTGSGPENSLSASSTPLAPLIPPQLTQALKVTLGGDLMTGRGVARRMLHNKSLSPLRALPPLRDEEWFITNLESVLGAPLQAWPLKAYHFQSDPALFPRLLKSARINPQRLIVSLANNHALDFDVQGLQSTLSTLEDLGVHHVGAGEDAATAWRPIIVGERGARLGILAVTDHCGCLDMCGWVAGAGRSGVAYRELSWGDQSPLLDAVKSLRAQAEGVIISLHSGPNYLDHPAKWMRNLAHQLIEAGADIIHFHSAHHVLPIERYRGRLIAYGLGDLLNDYKLNSQYRNDLGSTAVVTITPQQGGGRQLTVQLRPHQIRGGTLQTLKSDHPDFQWVMAHLSPDQTKK